MVISTCSAPLVGTLRCKGILVDLWKAYRRLGKISQCSALPVLGAAKGSLFPWATTYPQDTAEDAFPPSGRGGISQIHWIALSA